MSNKSKYYKHPKYKFVTTAFNEEIRTPVMRFAWPSLVTPKDPPPPTEGNPPGTPRYEVTGIMDPETPEFQAFDAKIKAMVPEMVAFFNEGNKSVITLDESRYFADGSAFDAEKYPYYVGKKLIVARNSQKVKVFNRTREEVGAEQLLGGMKGVLLLSPVITAHGLSFKLQGVQIVEDDGFRIGGVAKDVKAKFDDWSNEVPQPNAAEVAATAETPELSGKDAALNLL